MRKPPVLLLSTNFKKHSYLFRIKLGLKYPLRISIIIIRSCLKWKVEWGCWDLPPHLSIIPLTVRLGEVSNLGFFPCKMHEVDNNLNTT